MPVQRFAGQDPDIQKAMKAFMATRDVQNPAYELDGNGNFVETAAAQQASRELSKLSGGKSWKIRPANSVDALDGKPMWGSGSGVAESESGVWRPTAVLDPFMGSVHSYAHEGAHVLMPTKAQADRVTNNIAVTDPGLTPRDSGARMRQYHNMLSAITIGEEANAQGVATAITDKIGIPRTNEWEGNPLAYPRTYRFDGTNQYQDIEIGPMSPNEISEYNRIQRGINDYSERMFRQGYNAAR